MESAQITGDERPEVGSGGSQGPGPGCKEAFVPSQGRSRHQTNELQAAVCWCNVNVGYDYTLYPKWSSYADAPNLLKC